MTVDSNYLLEWGVPEPRINQQVMEFQQTLLKVDQALNSEDVQALVFLCADLLDKDVSCISTARDLFIHLQHLDHLTSQQPFLLVELLQLSRRSGLLPQLDLFNQPSAGLVSPYRKLLFNLSENIDADDLKSIKFLLQNKLPRRKLEDNVVSVQAGILSSSKHGAGTNPASRVYRHLTP
ncbi:hypothetical protein AAFF_G00254370 [Aldrovandia affinis]|uniref:DED domain-containing protein n=1 Tax=Aldrovandia affinis TaxID=143900 RepID=A0AAD7RD28_9TELE|nr:hypothetical protein AAFF_G00254370 [Aldrovandia affinis]